MIPIKEAVERAVEFAQDMFPNSRPILLEEVSRDTERRSEVWRITLSLPARAGLGTLGAGLGTLGGHREYKTFTVRGDNGEVISMRIRETADAK